ncbi:putative PSP1-domain-containing protein [Lyophyllum shimeji]|uniref:PSP1-domain-containing protein n=1 Tax=Lyophyllum shimeji TaxID=47721 RepID=A0A9P3UMX9_LYOSH|nr:putative PSP1-domain-containing protein [Lyophyllum shimeji]
MGFERDAGLILQGTGADSMGVAFELRGLVVWVVVRRETLRDMDGSRNTARMICKVGFKRVSVVFPIDSLSLLQSRKKQNPCITSQCSASPTSEDVIIQSDHSKHHPTQISKTSLRTDPPIVNPNSNPLHQKSSSLATLQNPSNFEQLRKLGMPTLQQSQSTSSVQQTPSDDPDDRHNRFTGAENGHGHGAGSLRERAASQPPRSSSDGSANALFSSPTQSPFIPSSLSRSSPWASSQQQRIVSPSTRHAQPVPIRSSSFSAAHSQGQFSSAMRERALYFPSTFEDDESEVGLIDSDTYPDERYVPPSLSSTRGRTPYGPDISRSRSQSLATATTRPGPVGSGSPYLGTTTSTMQSWNESFLSSAHSNPLNIPSSAGGRYGDIKPPGSRYGSLGSLNPLSGRNLLSSSPSGSSVLGNGSTNGYSTSRMPVNADISNQSPFVRDVGQILLDDGSAFRELWAGMHPPRDENGGGGDRSGTTSRRHSVSVVQPRSRGAGNNIVGFNAPGGGMEDEQPARPAGFGFATGGGARAGGGGGLMLSDDDLASDLGLLNMNPNEPPPPPRSSSQYQQPPSQPSSLPIYAPLSRSPPSRELISRSPYQSIGTNLGLNIPSSYSTRGLGGAGTPSDGGVSAGGGGNSPSVEQFAEVYGNGNGSARQTPQQQQQQQSQQQQQQELTARFIPGQGIQYLPTQSGGGVPQAQTPQAQYARTRTASYSSTSLASPISPTSAGGTRIINPQQAPFYPSHSPIQRRPSESQIHPASTHAQAAQPPPQPQPSLNDLGRGLPLSSVPPSWPLFIVEFKAGRTDLFYLTDLALAQEIRVGDLVIVEADRGRDLGKVVNDRITVGEVEAFQRGEGERSGVGLGYGGEGPTSPGGAGGGAQGAGGAQGGGQKKEINPKMIYGKAQAQDAQLLVAKMQDELKALQLCQSKVRAKKLPMEVVDAEYQWDRRKLTFYFIAEKRIDFRELVRELFRLYKTRIWMASLQGGASYEQ